MRWFVNSVVYFRSLSGVLVLGVCLVVSLCGWCWLCYIFKFLVSWFAVILLFVLLIALAGWVHWMRLLLGYCCRLCSRWFAC